MTGRGEAVREIDLQALALWALQNRTGNLSVEFLDRGAMDSPGDERPLCLVARCRGRITRYVVWNNSDAYRILRQLEDPLTCLALSVAPPEPEPGRKP